MISLRSKKAWVVAADMGYGHERAILPLREIAPRGAIINANSYPGIRASDRRIWEESRMFYEIVSRFKTFPVLGDFAFSLFDKFQEIKEFYPRDQSIDAPTLQLREIYSLMEHKAWGRQLIYKLNENPLPFVTTFFIPAHMAEYWEYDGPIYLVVPDTDVSRAWAPLKPGGSKIIYCAPTKRVAERLWRYGVPDRNIRYTGFPLPQEFTEKNAAKARHDLKRRLAILDPRMRYQNQYKTLIKKYVGSVPSAKAKKQPVRITFAIGGAGAQVDLVENILEGMTPLLKEKSVEFHVIAGIHAGVVVTLQDFVSKLGLHSFMNKSIFIHSSSSKRRYFQKFTTILRNTDILWTKPSELVFYTGLGIPILIAPPIGSQEEANKRWLLQVGAGIEQMDPELSYDWLPDFIDEGVFAEAAMQGFVEVKKDGVRNIIDLVTQRK
jgi:UDP-N-acetylglucosamine:LPS N-acetylglucosamine transferase